MAATATHWWTLCFGRRPRSPVEGPRTALEQKHRFPGIFSVMRHPIFLFKKNISIVSYSVDNLLTAREEEAEERLGHSSGERRAIIVVQTLCINIQTNTSRAVPTSQEWKRWVFKALVFYVLKTKNLERSDFLVFL